MQGSADTTQPQPVEVLARKLSQQKKLAIIVVVIFFSVLGFWGFYQQMKATSFEQARTEWYLAEKKFDQQLQTLIAPAIPVGGKVDPAASTGP
ncbi:MAG: hypothetical protein EOP09_20455, partial [Proteobacteria bacterium]